MYRRLLLLIASAGVLTLCAATAWADVPPPPVNQNIGLDDVSLGDLLEADCRVCHSSGVPDRHHMLYDQSIPDPTVVPYPDSDGDGNTDTNYSCLSCHDSNFTVVRDCTSCHNGSSPHHTTSLALGRDCVACHGDLVDNFDDGHYVPTYAPSLVTPGRSGGGAQPANSRNTLAGGCNYCHDDDGLTTPVILDNQALHHGTGLDNCNWCHDFGLPFEEQIRVCEDCHGPDSLHNIQADSPNAANIGTIVVGGEDAGYGHVGRDAGPGDSDCWGCHGFAIAGVTDPGPIIPTIGGSSLWVARAGVDTAVAVGGSGFTNVAGNRSFESQVLLTASNGSAINLVPESIVQDLLTVTIPSTAAPGNYRLRAVKEEHASNPAVISIVPEVVITEAIASGSTVTISGGGFSGYAAGSGTTVKAGETGPEGLVVSWTDTEIVAEFASAPAEVSVASVFGFANSEVSGVASAMFRRGDANADGAVDIADPVHTLEYLFAGGRASSCFDASDSDDNGELEVSDAISILGWLFTGGPQPTAPGPRSCGPDPTDDAFVDCDYGC